MMALLHVGADGGGGRGATSESDCFEDGSRGGHAHARVLTHVNPPPRSLSLMEGSQKEKKRRDCPIRPPNHEFKIHLVLARLASTTRLITEK